MKKLLYSLTIFIVLVSISFSAISYNPDPMTQRELNSQSMLAINWIQQSGEYRALTHQALNIAKVSFNVDTEQNITVTVEINGDQWGDSFGYA